MIHNVSLGTDPPPSKTQPSNFFSLLGTESFNKSPWADKKSW